MPRSPRPIEIDSLAEKLRFNTGAGECKNIVLSLIDISIGKQVKKESFLDNAHLEQRADLVIANPPFNESDWSRELLREYPRRRVTDKTCRRVTARFSRLRQRLL